MTIKRYWDHFSSPCGTLTVIVNDIGALRALRLNDSVPDMERDQARCAIVREQLDAYFAGTLEQFSLSLAPDGTAFQQRVWQALQKIPYGELRSYRDIAQRIGNSRAVRAVGQANGANPIPIIIPCHRVIASDGRIGGYSSGLDIKTRLLALEGVRLAA